MATVYLAHDLKHDRDVAITPRCHHTIARRIMAPHAA